MQNVPLSAQRAPLLPALELTESHQLSLVQSRQLLLKLNKEITSQQLVLVMYYIVCSLNIKVAVTKFGRLPQIRLDGSWFGARFGMAANIARCSAVECQLYIADSFMTRFCYCTENKSSIELFIGLCKIFHFRS